MSLTLTQFDFGLGFGILIFGGLGSVFVLPQAIWRRTVYGALAGIILGVVLMLTYSAIYEGDHPHGQYRLTEIVIAWRVWIVQLGALIGGTVGLLIPSLNSER